MSNFENVSKKFKNDFIKLLKIDFRNSMKEKLNNFYTKLFLKKFIKI